MNQKTKNGKLVWFVQLSVLVAILILFCFTKIGYLTIGPIEVTLNVIPVAVGAIVLGTKAGTVLGAVFGISSFIQCFTGSAFGAAILQISPVKAFITCVIPRILVGLFTGLIFKAIKNEKIGVPVASVSCALLNTVLFMSFFMVLYYSSGFAGYGAMLGTTEVFPFLAGFVGLNGALEAPLCLIVSSAVSAALLKANRKLH